MCSTNESLLCGFMKWMRCGFNANGRIIRSSRNESYEMRDSAVSYTTFSAIPCGSSSSAWSESRSWNSNSNSSWSWSRASCCPSTTSISMGDPYPSNSRIHTRTSPFSPSSAHYTGHHTGDSRCLGAFLPLGMALALCPYMQGKDTDRSGWEEEDWLA